MKYGDGLYIEGPIYPAPDAPEKSGGEYIRYVNRDDQGRVGGPYPVKFFQGYQCPERGYVEEFLRDGFVGAAA